MEQKVEFISYDGSFPNLCSGTLKLKIDGREVEFYPYSESGFRMYSGGFCTYSDEEDIIENGSWIVTVPDAYKEYKEEINEVVNQNVPWGCCGGCL